ncbi:MAG TPA: methionyl-tRNA formyltransferase, partial [Thermoanaerobaculia bacterium]
KLHSPTLRIAFFGTPDLAVPTLEALAREHEIAVVVAQPDTPAGRGMKLQAPAVAAKAKELGLPLMQPPKIRNDEFLGAIRELAPDAGIVVAYGKILPAALLAIPKHGFLNVHASILPKYRGAAPIQRAIEAGETETGVAIMRVDEELDHGPIFAIETLAIDPDEHSPALFRRLSSLGADALVRVLREIDRGTAVETPQDHAAATHAAKIAKEEGLVTFDEDAKTIYDRFRAFDPWPGIHLETGGETIKLTGIRPAQQTGIPRTILSIDPLIVAARTGAIEILTMQRPNKPRAAAPDVARALGWRAGDRIA